MISIRNSWKQIGNILTKCEELLLRFQDKDFLNRVYSQDIEFYMNRLKKIGFVNFEDVLDAGCGFGQWSIALSLVNKSVNTVDIDLKRVQVARIISQYFERSNIHFINCRLEKLPYRNEVFDGIFCYSVIYQTDYIKTFKEFFRVLRRGGMLYFSTNTWGWYIYNLIKNPKPSLDFSPRRHAILSLLNTVRFFVLKEKVAKRDLIMPQSSTLKILKQIGFKNIKIGDEGRIALIEEFKDLGKSIYPPKYLGFPTVYEIVATK